MSSHGLSATREFLAARDLLRALRDDHEAATARFSWPMTEHFNWALDWFDRIAVDNTRVALRVPAAVSTSTTSVSAVPSAISVTYAELSESSNRVANWLRRLGLRRGQRVLLMLDDQLAWCEVMLAAMKLGAVLISVRAAMAATDVGDVVGRAAPAFVIAAAHLTDLFGTESRATRICVGGKAAGWHAYSDAYLERRSFSPDGVTRADDPLVVYVTSGRSARPRLVCHTHFHPIGALPGTYWSGLLPGDVHPVVTRPGSAAHAWSSFFEPFNAEASVVALGPRGDVSARVLLDTLEQERVSSLCATSMLWTSLLREQELRPAALREARSIGATLAPDVASRARAAWGIDVREGYGQAETGALIGTTAGLAVRPGAMGKPLPGCPVVLLDPRSGAPSAEGEICVDFAQRPAGLMAGYLDDAEATAAACRGGFYRTGDLARRDEEGYLTYVGRIDQSISGLAELR